MDIFLRPRQYDMGDGTDGGAKNDGQAIQQAGNSAYGASQQTPSESSQYSGSFDIGSFLKQYLQGLLTGQQTGGVNAEQQFQNQGPLAQSVYNTTLNQAQNPTAGWQSTLQPQLEQAQNQINEYYNSRGLMNSGLAIGSSQQAGIDLAIQNAQNEMAYQQQSLQNATSLASGTAGLNQTNLSNLSNLYGTQQQAGLTSQQRQAQAANANAQYQAYPSQAALGNVYGLQQGGLQAAGQLGAAGLTALALA